MSTMVKDDYCLWDLAKQSTATEYDGLRKAMKAKRPAPISPEQFSLKLREQVATGDVGFTSSADLDFVIELYRSGFVEAFEKAARGNFV